MDQIAKFLKKLLPKEKRVIEDTVVRVLAHDFSGLDVKKLKGADNRFRVRKGSIRVIFRKDEKNIFILSIDRRDDTTYK